MFSDSPEFFSDSPGKNLRKFFKKMSMSTSLKILSSFASRESSGKLLYWPVKEALEHLSFGSQKTLSFWSSKKGSYNDHDYKKNIVENSLLVLEKSTPMENISFNH